MALVTLSPKVWRYLLAEQAAWGTAELDSIDFNAANNGAQLDIEHADYDEGISVLSRNVAAATRNPIAADQLPHVKQATPVVTMTGEAKQGELDLFLYMLFQKVTEGATTPFSKAFTFDKTGQPDFTVTSPQEGFFTTLIVDDPYTATSSQSLKFKDLVSRKLTLTCSPGEYLKFNTEIMGIGAPSHDAATASGTVARSTDSFWHYADIARATVNDGSSHDLDLEGVFEIGLTNTLTPIGQTGGEYATFVLGARPCTFKFSVVHGAITDTLRTAQRAGSQCDWRIGWGHATPGTDNGDLDIAFSGKINPDGITLNQGGEVSLVDVSGVILADDKDADGVTITMANALDRTW